MTLTNKYHNTSYKTLHSTNVVRLLFPSKWLNYKKELRWVKYVEKTLCGIDGCTCIKVDQLQQIAEM